MQTTTIFVHNKVGLHARPAALFVQAAMLYQSKITVTNGKKSSNAKSIIGVLALGVQQNNEITINADGPDEVDALAALRKLIEDNFGEPK